MTGVFLKKMSTLMISGNRFFLLFFFFISCQEKTNTFSIFGYAQGTTYSVKYNAQQELVLKKSVDSLLEVIDLSMSMYNEKSTIFRINNNETKELDSLIIHVIEKSIDICHFTDGMFDITVYPIVDDWGFSVTRDKKPTNMMDTSLYKIGCDKIFISGYDLFKHDLVRIDLNGIAQGFTVDYLSDYFYSQGVDDFMIEIGGEVKCSGNNLGNKWKIGIDSPNKGNHSFAHCSSISWRTRSCPG